MHHMQIWSIHLGSKGSTKEQAFVEGEVLVGQEWLPALQSPALPG